MMTEFELPTNFAALLSSSDEGGEGGGTRESGNDDGRENSYRIENEQDFEMERANESVERVCFELTENEPTRVLDLEIFEDVYHLVKNFRSLPTMSRVRVLDSLCANLSVLSASITALCVGNASDEEEEETKERERAGGAAEARSIRPRDVLAGGRVPTAATAAA